MQSAPTRPFAFMTKNRQKPTTSSAQDGSANKIWIIGCLALLALQIVGSQYSGLRVWGFHFFHYIPNWIVVLVCLLYGFAAFQGYIRKSIQSGKRPNPEGESSPQLLILLVIVFAASGFVFQTTTPLLGNSADILNRAIITTKGGHFDPGVLYSTQPLSTIFYMTASRVLRSAISFTPEDVFLVSGILAGVAFLIGAWKLAQRIVPDRAAMLAVLAVLIAPPSTLLFFGYIEFYAPMYACLVWYFYFSVAAMEESGPLWRPLVMLLVAAACHITAILLLPSALFLVFHRMRKRVPALKALALVIVTSAVAGLLYYFISPQHLGKGFFVPAFPVPGGQAYSLFAWEHIIDIVNLLILYMPVSGLLAFIGISLLKKDGTGESPAPGFALLSFAYPLMFIVSWNTLLGMARDWDVASFFGISSACAAVILAKDHPRFPVYLKRWSLRIAALSLASLLPWIGINASGYQSLLRYYSLMLMDAPHVSRQGTLTGWENIRKLYERSKDYTSELSIAGEMIKYSDDPFEVSKMMTAFSRAKDIQDEERVPTMGIDRLRAILDRYSHRDSLTRSDSSAVRRNFSRALVECLNYYYNRNRPKDAERIAQSFIDRFPRLSFGYSAAAYCAMRRFDYAAARAYSTNAANLPDADEVTFTTKGLAEMNLGLYDMAETSFRHSIAVNAELAMAYYGLGSVLLSQHKDSANAVLYLREYLTRTPGDEHARSILDSVTARLHL